MRVGESPTTIDWNRTLSLLLALAYLIAAGILGGGGFFFRTLAFLVLPMACIWYGEAMGDITGPGTSFLSGGPAITDASPGCMVKAAGWLVLSLPLVIMFILWVQS